VTLLGVVTAYVVGAVPVGFLVGRMFGAGDIRRHGSGNIGATNVMRTLGKGPAILTLVGDVVKGYLAVALGAALAGAAPAAVAACAVAAVGGNCWSIFLGFRGGKGVATGLGAFLRLVPLATAAAVPVFVVVVATTRYVSLGSLLAAACVPLGAWALGYPPSSALAAVGVVVIIALRHRENIARLAAGTEHRFGERSTTPPAAGVTSARP
jgi:acyl phosphate:glycerol-3-phosphate acyltransferase